MSYKGTGSRPPWEIARRWEAPSCPTLVRRQREATSLQPSQGEGRSPEGVYSRAPMTLETSATISVLIGTLAARARGDVSDDELRQ
jgi:hypothetical protein